MKEIILDVRSSSENDSSTGLCMREVLDRHAYASGLRGDLMFLSEGNGDIVERGREVSVGEVSSFLDVRSGDVLYGGVRANSVGTSYTKRGVVLSWSRNDSERKRFSDDFKLLGGGERVLLGEVGGDISRLPSVVEGVEIRIGGDGLDGSTFLGKIGDGSIVLTTGELAEYEFLEGEKIVYVADGSFRLRDEEFDEGLKIYTVGVELGYSVSDSDLLTVVNGEAFLSPVPYVYEHIYLRVGSEGHIGEEQISYFFSDVLLRSSALGANEVGVSLSSGLVRLGSGYLGKQIRYEGLLLGRNGDLVSELPVSNGGLVGAGSITSSGLDSYTGELLGLGYGSVFLKVGGVILLPVVKGNKAKRSDRAYFGSDKKLRVKSGVVLKGQIKGDGTLKLCQSFFPCRLNRVGVSQKKITGLTGSVETVSHGAVSYANGVITGGSATVSPSGHLVLNEGVDFSTYYSEIGAVPQGLGTGVVLALRGSTVNGFRSLVDFPVISRLKVGSTFQFLDFVPRTDFAGYSDSNFFKAGEILKKEVNLDYDFSDRKTPRLGWIEKRTKSAELKEPTSTFLLEAGVLPSSTSIKLSNGSQVETLFEGVDYDLPFNAQGGYARQINELGGEKARGFKTTDEGNGVVVLSDLTTYTPNLGDLLVFVSDSLYRQILVVEDLGGSGHRLTLSSANTYNARGEEVSTTLSGAWYIYAGQKDDIHPTNGADLMRVNDECFASVPLSDSPFIRVYKTYPIATSQATNIEDALKKVSPKSSLSVRLDDDTEIPLVVLSNEILPTRTLDLNSEYYTSSEYKILVDGVDKTSDAIIDGSTGLITFPTQLNIDDLSEVIFQPQPRVLTDRVEYLNSTSMTSPRDIVKILEELIEEEFKTQPLTGAISFSQPLLEGVGVEVDYKPTSTGVLKRETILFVKTLESCVRVSARQYTFSLGYYSSITPKVYLNTLETTKVAVKDGVLDFFIDVGESQKVGITYVREGSLGGEYSVKLSEPMTKTYYQINSGATSITLTERADLTSELENGDVIDFGTHSFFVTGVENNKITFTPSARFNLRVNEIKRTSRSDLFLHVNFENSHHFGAGKSLSSKKKSTDIFIKGDFRGVIFEDSILVVEGSIPYRVKNVSFLEEGLTKLTVHGYTSGHELNSFSLSIRPVPQEGAISLRPMGAIATDLGTVLIKQKNGLGLPLVADKDYLLEPNSGKITLFNGHTVKEGVRYSLRYTSITTVSPTYNEDGTVSYPKYRASYSVRVDATKYEGLPLTTKCTIETKDLFILPIVNEDTYASEIAAQLLQESSSTTGKKQSSVPSPRAGVSIGLFDHLARDVIARNKIKFYHSISNVVDDIKTTATGKIVGDQDGRFRFDLEQGSIDYVGAGLEDPITRTVEPRYTPLEYLSGLGITKTAEDNYDNLTVSTFSDIYKNQKLFLENEMDDYVFIRSRSEIKLKTSLFSREIEIETVPVYNQMWQSHSLSRLFPQSANFFSILYPADKYSYDTTNGFLIGQVENPARQEITNISGLSVIKKRPCRMRILDFKPFGFPNEASTLGKPTFLVSVVPFEEFPYGSDGNPDTDKLYWSGSNDPAPTIPSVETGNPSLSFRGLATNSILELGRQDEGFSVLLDVSEQKSSDATLFPDISLSAPKKVRVGGVVKGCYVYLEGNASSIEWKGSSLLESLPVKGDTLLESLQGDIDDVESRGGTFRVGSDIGVSLGTGEIIDISLPSMDDPNFPLKEIFEQNVPQPLTAIEGTARTFNVSLTPFDFPALQGEYTNDDGDETIPYLSQLSERELLADISNAITKILRTEFSNQYVYPDEIADDSASISDDKLTLTKSLKPKTGGGIGCKDVEQGDLVLIDLDDGATGFIEVSTVDGNSILPPRFKAPVAAGNIQYYIDKFFVSDVSANNIGLSIEQIPHNGGFLTKFLLATNEAPTTYPTFDGLITFIQNATTVAKENSFEVSFLGQVFNFHYDGSNWHFHYGDVNQNHTPVTIETYGTNQGNPIITRGFEIQYATALIPNTIWTDIGSAGGVFSTFDAGTKTYALDGSSGVGHDYEIALNFKETTFYSGGSPVPKTGGSQTATIGDDRLTFSENASFLKDITHSTTTLEVFSSTVLGNPSNINKSAIINNGDPFDDLTITSEGLRVPAFRGYGNTTINKSDLKLSVLVGSKVDESSLIYEETGETLNYTLGAIEASSSLDQVLPNDLVFIKHGHSAGTHRVLGAVKENNTSLVYTVVAPKITQVVDNGDGTFNITISAPISDYYTVSPSQLGVILNKAGVRNSDPLVAVTHGVLLTVVIASESTFVVSAIATDLGGASWIGGAMSELIKVGQDLIGFEKIPFDPSRTAIGFEFRNFVSTAVSVANSYQHPVTPTTLATQYAITDTHLSLLRSSPSTYQNVLTGDIITLTVDIKKGIYIDPTFPRMNHDYSRTFPNYFNSDPTQAYGLYVPSGFSSELVDVSVRRLRRFGDIFSKLATAFDSLNPLYEVRKGIVNTLVKTGDLVDLTPTKVNRQGADDPLGTDTQVGDFANVVSIGDKITILNSSNEQAMRLKVLSVESPLKCLYISGTVPDPLTDVTFKIEVRKGMIPHLQSYEKFMDLGFTEVLSSTTGKAEDEDGVKLKDSDGSINFLSLTNDVLKDGHYLIIDPIGKLDSDDEIGSPPTGDTGKTGTTGFIAGTVNPLDDNRGVYKITTVAADNLALEQVVPTEGIAPSGYNLLPSVDGVDGIGLRATKPKENNTHNDPTNNTFSVEPFPYRIVKRKSELAEELVDSFLFMRERTLSWVEAINSYSEIKSFSWSEYQAQNLVQYIGENDRTYLTNSELLGIEGVYSNPKPEDVAFVTDSDCLSVLDRRFLIEDPRLSFEGYYEVGEGLPSILENGISFMEAREKRYSWLNVRVNKLNGTLPKISRVDFDNPNNKALEDINDE